MFQSVVLSSHFGFDPISNLGAIAESLLFYQNVHLVLDIGGFRTLAQVENGALLDEIASIPSLTLTFCPTFLATMTDDKGGVATHSYFQGTMVGVKGRPKTSKPILSDLFFDVVQRDWKSKRRLKNIEKKATNADIFSFPNAGTVTGQALDDIRNSDFFKFSATEVLTHFVGSEAVPSEFRFRAIEVTGGFFIETDLDFAHLSKTYQRRFGLSENEKITPALLACGALEARGLLAASARYGAEFVAAPRHSEILKRQIKGLRFPRERSVEEISDFQEINLGSQCDIRTYIGNSSGRFREFLPILAKATKFRHWLAGVNPDEGLLRAYQNEILEKSLIERLPAKILRFAMFTGLGEIVAGQAGAAAGVAAGAIDSFLVDKIFKGWKPNHFVDNQLKKFLTP